MFRSLGWALTLLCAAVPLAAGTHFRARPGERVIPNQYLVMMSPDTRPPRGRATRLHGNLHLVEAPSDASDSFADDLAALPGVEFVEPNRARRAAALLSPNDTLYSGLQSYLSALNAPTAWSVMPGHFLVTTPPESGRIKVAVIDSGVDCSHPDFINIGGTSTDAALGGQLSFALSHAYAHTTITNPVCPWQDDYGHGTHVAGTVAAATQNALGVASLGYPLEVIAYKVLDSSGQASSATVTQAILAATDAGARVINLSLDGGGYSQAEQYAVNYAWQHDTIVIAAAGNDSSTAFVYPAAYNHLIAVSSSDTSGNLAYFSNSGIDVSLAALGLDVESTFVTYSVPDNPNTRDYTALSGTSVSAPQVSALAGLLSMASAGTSAAAIIQRMEQTANSPVSNGGWGPQFGFGTIDAGAAVAGPLRVTTIGSIVGQVVDSRGFPIPSATVKLQGPAAATFVTDQTTGLFRFANLVPGTYTVTASSGTTQQAITAVVTAGADTNIVVPLSVSLATVLGTVTDGLHPVSGAIVQALSAALVQATAVADANGAFTLPVQPGTFTLKASCYGHQTTTSDPVTVAATGTTGVNLSLPVFGKVNGTAKTLNGTAAANVSLLFTSGSFTAGAVTDSAGHFTTIGLPAGSYAVQSSGVTVASLTLTNGSATTINPVVGTQVYQVTTQTFPSDGGTITPASTPFFAGTPLTFAATPNPGFLFSGFTGIPSATTTLTSPLTVTANFILDNPSFVSRQYLDLLNRTPDAAGLAYWRALLDSSTLTRPQVAAQFFTSPEFSNTGLYLIKLYLAILGRDPDFNGWLYWFNAARGGAALPDILRQFLTAPEFQSRYGALSNSDFMTLVYRNVLGRAPDSAGLQFWVGQLTTGVMSRSDVMDQFIRSPEYTTLIRPRAYANLLYLGFLRRTADPTGLTYWQGVLAAGAALADVVGSFVNSPEYMGRF